jgi:hypothetical protein
MAAKKFRQIQEFVQCQRPAPWRCADQGLAKHLGFKHPVGGRHQSDARFNPRRSAFENGSPRPCCYRQWQFFIAPLAWLLLPVDKFPFYFADFVPSTELGASLVSCEENTCSTARAASCSSSPVASMSRAVPMVAHNERMLKMLRKSATFPLHFSRMVERNRLLNRTRCAAGRRCNPSRQEITTLERFITDYSTDIRRIQLNLRARPEILQRLKINPLQIHSGNLWKWPKVKFREKRSSRWRNTGRSSPLR